VSDRIDNLKLLIERSEKCRAIHVETAVIKERYDNRVIWEGVVETFQLDWHATAKRAYAWVRPQNAGENPEPEYTIVLGLPPVNSAEDAVKVAVVNHLRNLFAPSRRLGGEESVRLKVKTAGKVAIAAKAKGHQRK